MTHVLYIGPTREAFLDGETVDLIGGQVYSGRVAEDLASKFPTMVRPCDERGAVTRVAAP